MNIGYKRFTQSQISLFSSFLLKKQRDRLVTRTVDTFPLVHKIIKKKQQDIFSQFEFALSLHDPFNNSFRPSFLARQTADGGNHLVIGFPFVT